MPELALHFTIDVYIKEIIKNINFVFKGSCNESNLSIPSI